MDIRNIARLASMGHAVARQIYQQYQQHYAQQQQQSLQVRSSPSGLGQLGQSALNPQSPQSVENQARRQQEQAHLVDHRQQQVQQRLQASGQATHQLQPSAPAQTVQPQPSPHQQPQQHQPAPPPTRERTWVEQQVTETGQITEITRTSEMTAEEWERTKYERRERQETIREIMDMRDVYQTGIAAVQDAIERRSAQLHSDFQIEYQGLQDEVAELNHRLVMAGMLGGDPDDPDSVYIPDQPGSANDFFTVYDDFSEVEADLQRLDDIANYTSEGGLFHHRYESRMQGILAAEQWAYERFAPDDDFLPDYRSTFDVALTPLKGLLQGLMRGVHTGMHVVDQRIRDGDAAETLFGLDREQEIADMPAEYRHMIDDPDEHTTPLQDIRRQLFGEEDLRIWSPEAVDFDRFAGGAPTLEEYREEHHPSLSDSNWFGYYDAFHNFFVDWGVAWEASEGQYTFQRPVDAEWAYPEGYFDDDDYSFGDQVAQFAIDALQDPTSYFGGAAIRGIGRTVRGTRGAEQIAQLSRTQADRLLRTPAGERVSDVFRWLADKPNILKNRVEQLRRQTIETAIEHVGRVSPPAARQLQRQIGEFDIVRRQRLRFETLRQRALRQARDQVRRALRADISGMTRQQIRLLQRTLRTGENPFHLAEGSRLTTNQILRVRQVSDKWRREFDTMWAVEQTLEIPSAYRSNYVPDPGVVGFRFKGKQPSTDDVWWFQRRKTRPRRMTSDRRFIRNIEHRMVSHRVATGELPFMSDIRRQLERYGYSPVESAEFARNIVVPHRQVRPRGFWEEITLPFQKAYSQWRMFQTIFRPAFYLNNEISNQLLGITEGGWRFLVNQSWTGQRLERKLRAYGITADDIAGNFSEHIGTSSVVRTSTRPQPYKRLQEEAGQIATQQENRVRMALYQTRFNEALDEWIDIYLARGQSINTATANATRRAQLEAKRSVHNTFFDYSTRRIDVIPRTMIPFWHWQKNIALYVFKLPFRNPRASQTINRTHRLLYEQPLEQLERMVQEAGDDVAFDPTEIAEGRMYNPLNDTWINTPFNPFAPTTHAMWGVNPVLTAVEEWRSGEDLFGSQLDPFHPTYADFEHNPLASLTGLTGSLIQTTPQGQIVNGLISAWRQEVGARFTEERWLASGSLYPKMSQGHDAALDSYVARLDNRHGTLFGENKVWGLGQDITRFLGRPSSWQFDAAEWFENQMYAQFTNEFFDTDWDQYEWDERVELQEQLARDYGFDLQDDIYDGRWSRFDTWWTTQRKILKREASEFNQQFWSDYMDVPEGERTRFVQEKRLEWAREGTMLDNPYFDVVREWMIDPEFMHPDSKIHQLDFWEAYWNVPEDDRHTRLQMLIDNPQYTDTPRYELVFWQTYFAANDDKKRRMRENNPTMFRSMTGSRRYQQGIARQANHHWNRSFESAYRESEEGQFWEAFFSIKDSRERIRFYALNWRPEFAGEGLENPQETLFWLEYYDSDPSRRREMLRKNPQYSRFDSEEFDYQEWNEFLQDRIQQHLAAGREHLDGFGELVDYWIAHHNAYLDGRAQFIRPRQRRIDYQIR